MVYLIGIVDVVDEALYYYLEKNDWDAVKDFSGITKDRIEELYRDGCIGTETYDDFRTKMNHLMDSIAKKDSNATERALKQIRSYVWAASVDVSEICKPRYRLRIISRLLRR